VIPQITQFLAGYFDGATQLEGCGCGAQIDVSTSLRYKFYLCGGEGTNSRAEVLALWGLLYCARWLDIDSIHIFGDSRVVIEWINRKATFAPPYLQKRMHRILVLMNAFLRISFNHIYREHNYSADLLSKKGIRVQPGSIHYEAFRMDTRCQVGKLPME